MTQPELHAPPDVMQYTSPYLAAYWSPFGRDRLARTPIHAEHNSRGDSDLECPRAAHEGLAPVSMSGGPRGLPVVPCARGRRELRKPDFDGVLTATGAPAAAADRRANDAASRSPRRSEVETAHPGIP